MGESFAINKGAIILDNLILVIQDNKEFLSDIDGAIGDGDHGINMNKGFTACRTELNRNCGDLIHGFKILSRILMMRIGGSMGPLYGRFFQAIAKTLEGNSVVDKVLWGKANDEVLNALAALSPAKVGDKTMMDTLLPAVNAYRDALTDNKSFSECLAALQLASIQGRDSTEDMIAKVGRASRLGERSRGVLDAGAVSCCLILGSMSDSIIQLVNCSDKQEN